MIGCYVEKMSTVLWHCLFMRISFSQVYKGVFSSFCAQMSAASAEKETKFTTKIAKGA